MLAQGADILPFMPQPEQEIPVSFVMKFSKINEAQNIAAPAGAERFEDFVQKVFEPEMAASGDTGLLNPSKIYGQSSNTKRMSDINAIMNAINMYQVDTQKLPVGISAVKKTISKDGADICASLVPTYLANFPVDPNINTGRPITDRSVSYFTGYTIQSSGTSVTITAPYAELGETISLTR